MNAIVTRRIEIAIDHPSFAGHFPGHPILPGVALVAEVLEVVRGEPALHTLIGDAPQLAVAKFTAPVPPGAALEIALRASATGLAFEVRHGAHIAASGRFAAAPAAAIATNEAAA